MQNSLRTIFHVDVNSAFLSWSALKRLQEDPGSVDLRTIPSAVGGDVKTRHGVITAKSIPAKKYGVRTGEPVVKALQKCPQLITVPPDFETYRAYSHRLMDMLFALTPLVQQVSIDEAYLDVTELVSPEDREGAAALARSIRASVLAKLGFTVNVGISVNKLLAKMASDFEKPDRTHTLYPDEIQKKMWPLPIGELYGCGRATAEKLRLVGIDTIGDAAQADPAQLRSLLGPKAGMYISRSANGIGSTNVTPEREKAKSISNERTLSEDVNRDNYETNGIPVIRWLVQKVSDRMKKAGVAAQTVTLQVKSADFQRYSRQSSLPEATDSPAVLEDACLQLAERLLTGTEGLFSDGVPVRLIGVGVSRLSEKKMHQMDLFEWADQQQTEDEQAAAEAERRKRQEKENLLSSMLQQVNERYGEGTLIRGNPHISDPK
ncbi:MAG: DNA polymerase IV [Lachnospiraceae bacterium]|nr:DNA polymerase IV [Lachnospiraceae bacterium]